MDVIKIICEHIGAIVLTLFVGWSIVSAITLLVETSQHEIAHMKPALPAYVLVAICAGIVWFFVGIIRIATLDEKTSKAK